MSTHPVVKAKVTWSVYIQANGNSSEGVTLNVSTNGAYIRCAKPLRLNEVFAMTLQVPNTDDSIEAEVEVVFSNIYGPDDQISPRGMGVRFLEISSQHRKIIAKAISQQLQSDKVKIDPQNLKNLQTLTLNPNEMGSEAAFA